VTSLAAQQQALLQTLFEWPEQNAIDLIALEDRNARARGLKAYKTNAHMLAERVLAAAYPVVGQLLGSESLGELARALWHAHPPVRGDLGCWGDSLADFLRVSEQLQDEAYLPDVARAEWALHQCATAADQSTDPASLALLTTQEPDTLGLSLAPGCCVVCSAWPLASILGAHVHGAPNLAEVGQELRAAVSQDLVIWRRGLRPDFRQAMPGEALMLSALLGGASLGQALDAAETLDFGLWFPMAIQSQLILGVFVFSSNPTSPHHHEP
jgi:hypothetical protein